ncbi:MAG: YbaN family protein [Prevotellaceae bacterium]|nr:YbaN family protein [Prevotellaceae bacterium]
MKYLFVSLGIISLGLGVLGIFLPILPTTPFLLLSAALFAKSSKKLYKWLINHKILGGYIRNFLLDKSIPLQIKIIAVTFLWATMLSTIFLSAKALWLQIFLFVLAVGITVHILSYKTKKTVDNQ